jgi:hypothetical protein
MTYSNRRRWERFQMPEDAVAFDAKGRRLGKVTMAGGGGMAIHLEDRTAQFQRGDRLQVTVVETDRDIQHTIQVSVRYQQEDLLGVEFGNQEN